MNVLANRNFFRVWLAQIISVVGDGAYYIAIMWWAKSHTGSDALVALIALSAAVPGVLLGPVGGAYADRLDRRKLMIAMDLARAAVIVAPAALLAAGRLEGWHLCVTAAVLATASSFFGPAFSASVPNLVTPAQLEAANGLQQASGALGGLLGPALGGILVATLGPTQAVLVDAASFIASAALIAASRIPSPARAVTGTHAALGRDLLEGLRFFRSQGFLWGLMLLSAALNFFAAPLQVLLPGLARDVLHTGPEGFGLLEAMIPAGFIAGGIGVGLLRARRIGVLVITMTVAAGLLFAALGVSRAVPVSAALLAASGFTLAVTNILIITVLQRRIPTGIQGRAFGALGTLSGGLRPLGLAFAAPGIAAFGVPAMFVACGLAVSLVSLAGFLVPGMARLERDAAPPHDPAATNGTALAAD